MPRRQTATALQTHQTLKNIAQESRVVSWLMQDGWQVFVPMLDYGHKTDILISDGPKYYRLQVKTLQAGGIAQSVENRWAGSNIDVVIYFAHHANWGFVVPAFSEKKRKLNAPGHERFEQNRADFLKAFHKV